MDLNQITGTVTSAGSRAIAIIKKFGWIILATVGIVIGIIIGVGGGLRYTSGGCVVHGVDKSQVPALIGYCDRNRRQSVVKFLVDENIVKKDNLKFDAIINYIENGVR